MTTIIETGSGGGSSQNQGASSWFDKLLPIAVIAVVGYLAYTLISKSGLLTGNTGTTTQQTNLPSGQNTVQQTPVYQQLPSTQQQQQNIPVLDYSGLVAALAAASKNPVQQVNVGTVPAVITQAGPNTPTNFFPGGNNIITSSRALDAQEAQLVVNNLLYSQASQGITNAWWQPEKISNPNNYGLNAAGSPQSNIPSGTKHCACTAALKAAGVCGMGDDWYYC